MEDLVEKYIEIRNYLESYLKQTLNIYFTDIWNPLMKFVVIKETNTLIENVLSNMYPDFPKKFLPKVKFRIFEDDEEIEAGIQMYLNKASDLTFLGSSTLGGVDYDFYLKKSYDPSYEYIFYARYGHDIDNIYTGTRAAASEYFTGAYTPLSVAFGMAVEDGFIE